MCLTPIHLKTNAKYISPNGYKRFYVDVPCGKCVECQQQKKNEWFVRNYYESLMTWNKGGYILFDTLTYSDEFINKISKVVLGFDLDDREIWWKLLDWMIQNNVSDLDPVYVVKQFRNNDYSCFYYHDIQNFLKLLRIRLQRAGFDVKDNLRYFIASEYGHEESYIDSKGRYRKGTARPHYHVLFYVNDPSLDPVVLSQYISDAWTYGRTDGYVYRGRAYVYNNTFGPKYIKDPNRLRGVQMYTTKYVCKDYEFSETVDLRMSSILRDVYMLSFASSDYRDKKRYLHRNMDQFHRQSLGFGLNAINDSDVLDLLWSEGVFRLPDKQRVTKDFVVPMYYIRKLFQKCVKDSEGTLHWVWTDLGKDWKIQRMRSNVSRLALKMQDWYDNLSIYLKDNYYFDATEFMSRISELLGERTWKDYAIYILFYKDRVSRDRFWPDSFDSIVSKMFDDDYLRGDYLKEISPGVYQSEDFICDNDMLRDYCVMKDDCLGDTFLGFDRISQLYTISMVSWNKQKQKTYEDKLLLQKTLKSLGYKCKKDI